MAISWLSFSRIHTFCHTPRRTAIFARQGATSRSQQISSCGWVWGGRGGLGVDQPFGWAWSPPEDLRAVQGDTRAPESRCNSPPTTRGSEGGCEGGCGGKRGGMEDRTTLDVQQTRIIDDRQPRDGGRLTSNQRRSTDDRLQPDRLQPATVDRRQTGGGALNAQPETVDRREPWRASGEAQSQT